MAMRGFYWLIEGALAGSSRPGQRERRRAVAGGEQDRAGATDALDADLAWLREQGIGAVLSLTETPLEAGALERHGLVGLHLPVDDLHPPTPAQLEQAIAPFRTPQYEWRLIRSGLEDVFIHRTGHRFWTEGEDKKQ